MTKEQLAAAIVAAFPKTTDGQTTQEVADLSNKLADAIYQFVIEQINISKS